MANIAPFSALLPSAAILGTLLKRRGLDSDLPAGFSVYQMLRPLAHRQQGLELEAALDKARESFEAQRLAGNFAPVQQPCLYAYELSRGHILQRGVVALVSTDDYDQGRILKHELTRGAREQLLSTFVQRTGLNITPVMLFHEGRDELALLLRALMRDTPTLSVQADDGTQHRLWLVQNADDIAELTGIYAALPKLFIADGHHRAASMGRFAKAKGEAVWFSAALFAAEELHVWPFYRLLAPGGLLNTESLLTMLKSKFKMDELAGPVAPMQADEVLMRLAGQWWMLHCPINHGELNVDALHREVIGKVFGIVDAQNDPRIDYQPFDGSFNGMAERELAGEFLAVLLPKAVTAEDIMDVSETGQTLPPKSTCFEPKVASGLIIQQL